MQHTGKQWRTQKTVRRNATDNRPFLYLCSRKKKRQMEIFRLHILGCGSAIPTTKHNPSSQVLNIREKLFMIDCGEGTQLQFRKAGLKFSRLNNIFISHMHGDHCFGLVGIISTMALLGRTAGLRIFLPEGGQDVFKAQTDYFCQDNPFEIEFVPFDSRKREVIYQDRSVSVETIPLKHRIACAGFLFRETQGPRHINREMCDFHRVPQYMMGRIKNGEDFVNDEGETIANSLLTTPANPARSYAYCSDTAYLPGLKEQIAGVDLLYHETTFAESEAKRAAETFHTTTTQAATIAAEAKVKRLLTGHYSARYTDIRPLAEECRRIFARTTAAEEGMCIDI